MLRPWREADAPAVYAACQDPEIQRWIPLVPRPYTRDDAHAFVTTGHGDGQGFAIVRDDELLGSIALHPKGHDTAAVGYWCAAHARRHGIATRALRRLCRHAFDDRGLERLELVADPENFASHRVAAKAGFRREGLLRSHLSHPEGHRRDSVLFSLLPGELQ